MYTLRMPFMRLYVVNSPALVQKVQRQTRKLSFTPILAQMTSSVTGVSAAGDLAGDPLGAHSFVHGLTNKIRGGVNPGPKLDALNRSSVEVIAQSLGRLGRKHGKVPFRVDMRDWVYHEVMMATTEGIYGPKNPFRETEMRKAFPTYEQGFLKLMMNILPKWTSPESVRARSVLEQGYLRYFHQDGHSDPESSDLIKSKYEFCKESGLSDFDTARMEVLAAIALLSNTMPATFWLAFHLYSDPELLQACRDELEQAVIIHEGGVRSIDMACVKSRCPLLLSTFQEVLRYYAVGVSSRRVIEDTIIEDPDNERKSYLVKKGGIIFIPGAAHHKLRSAWGEYADQFVARRFVPGDKSGGVAGGKNGRTYDAAAFRAFGGGATLCPGRHFVSTEILAFAAFIVLRFDAHVTTGAGKGKGEWTPPSTEKTAPAATIRQPDYGFEIELCGRDEFEWSVQFSESDKPMPVSVEDMGRE
ncbi:cytochrome P450 [Xylariaceae sp. FL0255]|nr:cytochrome P450 [Xylariaceae sp. FL0255]